MLIKVDLPFSPYLVRVGESIEELGIRVKEYTDSERVFIVSDRSVSGLYIDRVSAALKKCGLKFDIFIVEDGEGSKSLHKAKEIYMEMSRRRVERFTPVLGFGGGVVGDLAGFSASTYLRGVPFINVPTSLLAQVDSAVGGKTGVNLPSGKNLVGTFYQPLYVHTDTELLGTLSEREYASGLAEVVKHALIQGERFLGFIRDNADSILSRDSAVMEVAVSECVKIKASVVVEDEKERGLRRVLNLGHTLGHALETSGGYGKLTHGEAVSIGMVAACRISEYLGGKSITEEVVEVLERLGLPVGITGDHDPEKLIEIMKLDKKVRRGRIEFVLPFSPGEVRPGVEVEEKLIKEVIRELEQA